MTTKPPLDWDMIIEGQKKPLSLGVKDIWRYRDLLILFVKRDIVTVYKQTILGPLWFFLQPVLTTITFVFIFGNLAKISTDGLPQILFYLSGVTIWNYFSETLNNTSKTFTENAHIFGKVYFPRLVLPLSKVISGIIKFLIQFGLFLVVLFYFLFFTESKVEPNAAILLTPLLLIIMAALGLSFGIIISSLTIKYRDLTFLIAFGIQLLMYATPVIYPISTIPDAYKIYIWLNPLTSIVETFKYGFLGSGQFSWGWLLYSTVFSVLVLVLGILMFNKVERRFIDSI